MIAAVAVIWCIVSTLAVLVYRRQGCPGLIAAGKMGLEQGYALVLRLPLAILAASFLMQVLPVDALVPYIGPQSGITGILIASVLGGVFPGGPMTSFPIAVVILQGGAGFPQIVALITGWSVFAIHRVLAYEAPIMGWRFVGLRLAACVILPPTAGLLAQGFIAVLG